MENEFQTWLNQIGAKGRFLQRGKKVGKSSPYFNNAIVEQSPVRNYLDMNLDSKLLFTEYINGKKNEAVRENKSIEKICFEN